MEESTIKHLEMIQNIVSRMNKNSFQIKGYAIAIASALFAFYDKHDGLSISAIGIPAMIILWILDSYYLKQERVFRAIYNDVLSSDKKIGAFEMPFEEYRQFKFHIINSMFISVNGFIYLAVMGCFISTQILM